MELKRAHIEALEEEVCLWVRFRSRKADYCMARPGALNEPGWLRKVAMRSLEQSRKKGPCIHQVYPPPAAHHLGMTSNRPLCELPVDPLQPQHSFASSAVRSIEDFQ